MELSVGTTAHTRIQKGRNSTWLDPEPTIIEFPGILKLWARFRRETPKSEFEVDRDNLR